MTTIVKESGKIEEFSGEKFCGSLREAGGDEALIEGVCHEIENGLTPGETSTDIFRKASQILLSRNLHVATRYNLKRGMRELGPAGFVFEQFVEVILKTLGFSTYRDRMIPGQCVPHEVDVVAEKKNEHFLIEAKYHNQPGIKVHIDVVMYADARLEDIFRGEEDEGGHRVLHKMWVFTNTKFTEKAITYGACRGLLLTGWHYPHGESLEVLITKHRLYPITVLPSVDMGVLPIFAKHNLMLAQDIAPYSQADLIKQFGLRPGQAEKISKEAQALLYGEGKEGGY